MASVTQRINSIQQPKGGYLPVKLFDKKVLQDEEALNETENIHASLVGMAVDYLTRFMLGNSSEDAFRVSLIGAALLDMKPKAVSLMKKIVGLDDDSIKAACQLVGFDVCARSSVASYKPIETIQPDQATIENIRIMVKRSISFWETYGPIVCSGPTFEGGYTATINQGDGDFVTKDTLWDFKVSKTKPTSKHTLQLLVYYIMGQHSQHDHLKRIKYLGIFNPRLNLIYLCPVSAIFQESMEEVARSVIGYNTDVTADDIMRNHGLLPAEGITLAKEFTVNDLCQMTGLNKKAIYEDIRSGLLTACKKRNKYYISSMDCQKYIEEIKHRKRITRIALIVWIGLILLALLIIAWR